MTPSDASLAGTLLERRYRVDAPIARGGMSSVYRGTDTRLDRPIAIKIMDPRFADDRSFVDRFEREARSAARLHHPNVVTVHDQGVDGAHIFLVMELVDGGTLRDLLDERGRLDVPLALSVAEHMLAALATAHQAGLVHRDVKPENVLIGRTGTPPAGVVKVADFGLVRAVASAGTTSSSIILGTVAYLSPEQVTTGMAAERGDVYSAGVVLYEMLTGQVPYTGDTAISVAYRHVNDDVPAPSASTPGLPAAVDELVLRATRREPAARPADAGAFLAELRQVRASLGLEPAPIPVPVAKPAPAPTPTPPPQSSSVRPPWAVGDAERTVPAMSPVAPPPQAAQAAAPTSFTAAAPMAGPRGTRAMSRPPHPAHPAQPHPAREPGPSGAKAKLAALLRDKRARWAAGGVFAVALLIVGLVALAGEQKSSRTVTVPQVAGMDRATAAKTLSDNGFSAKFTQQRNNTVAAGLAIRSDPTAGTGALRGAEVTVVLSAGRPTVPDIGASTSLNQAESAIIAAELVPVHDESADQYSTTVAEGNVISVSPQPGTQLDVGAKVTIVVSKGRPPQPVPDVTGLPHDEAFQLLRQQGFEPYDAGTEYSENAPTGYVTRTSPEAGEQIQAGSPRVGVYVSNAVAVPSVVGHSIEEAMQTLQEAGLQPDLKGRDHGFGIIAQQEPSGGELVKKGSKVNLRAIP